jgi:hypothetical protein
LQLCAHQRLQPRALCSILHNLACLLVSQQQSQQQQQQSHQQPSLPQQLEQSGVPRTAAGLPQPLLQQLLAATQHVLEHAASNGFNQQLAGVLQQEEQDVPRLQQQQQQPQGHQPERQHWQQQVSCDALPVNALQMQQQQQRQCGPDQQLAVGTRSSAADQTHPLHVQQEPVLQQQQQHQHRQQQQLGDPHQQLPPLLQQQQYHPHQQQQLTPAGLVTLADSLRRLKSDPPKAWQAAYVAAAARLMHSRDARNVPLMLAPCVRWRQSPGQDWLQQYLAACQGLLPTMHRQVSAVGILL